MGYGNKSIYDWQDDAHTTSRDKGWWDEQKHPAGESRLDIEKVKEQIPIKLCLIHSEVSEALEAYRDGKPLFYRGENDKPEGVMAELADVVIRCMDLAGALNQNLEAAIREKHYYNQSRPHRHGGKKV